MRSSLPRSQHCSKSRVPFRPVPGSPRASPGPSWGFQGGRWPWDRLLQGDGNGEAPGRGLRERGALGRVAPVLALVPVTLPGPVPIPDPVPVAALVLLAVPVQVPISAPVLVTVPVQVRVLVLLPVSVSVPVSVPVPSSATGPCPRVGASPGTSSATGPCSRVGASPGISPGPSADPDPSSHPLGGACLSVSASPISSPAAGPGADPRISRGPGRRPGCPCRCRCRGSAGARGRFRWQQSAAKGGAERGGGAGGPGAVPRGPYLRRRRAAAPPCPWLSRAPRGCSAPPFAGAIPRAALAPRPPPPPPAGSPRRRRARDLGRGRPLPRGARSGARRRPPWISGTRARRSAARATRSCCGGCWCWGCAPWSRWCSTTSRWVEEGVWLGEAAPGRGLSPFGRSPALHGGALAQGRPLREVSTSFWRGFLLREVPFWDCESQDEQCPFRTCRCGIGVLQGWLQIGGIFRSGRVPVLQDVGACQGYSHAGGCQAWAGGLSP